MSQTLQVPDWLRLRVSPHRYTGFVAVLLEIENLTELSVGGSATDVVLGSGVTENPVAKMPMLVSYGGEPVAEIVPYIPGSTVKGLLRSYAEVKVKSEDASRGASVQLRRLLQRMFGGGVDARSAAEIIEKVFKPVALQYVDERVVNGLVSKFRGLEPRDLARILEGGEELRKVVEEVVEDKAAALALGSIIVSALDTYTVSPSSCDPTVEGLACAFPVPQFKLHILKALAELANIQSVEYPCRVCRVFGAPSYASRLVVFDALPLGLKSVTILLRTHIAIDRIRGTVAQGRTFDVEYLAPGAKFLSVIVYYAQLRRSESGDPEEEKGEKGAQSSGGLYEEFKKLAEEQKLKLTPDDDENLRLLLGVIDELSNKEVYIGRRKTAGMGLVKVKPLALSVGVSGKVMKCRDLVRSGDCVKKDKKDDEKDKNGKDEVKDLKDYIESYAKNGIPLTLEELLKAFFEVKTQVKAGKGGGDECRG